MPVANGGIDELNAVSAHGLPSGVLECWYDQIRSTLFEVLNPVLYHSELLKRHAEKFHGVIEHNFLAYFRFHVDLLKLFQPALDADGRPIGAEHRLILQ